MGVDLMALFGTARGRLVSALLMATACGGGYVAIGTFNCQRFRFMEMPSITSFGIDAHIPFLPGWVWIYLLYYPFCFLPVMLSEVRNQAAVFGKTLAAFALQFAVSFAFFLLFPLRMVHPLVPITLNGAILARLYQFDLGFNSFPSLHLANIVFVFFLFWRLRGKFWGSLVGASALLIAVSTLLVKQHIVWDALAGAVLGWASYAVMFRELSPHPRAKEVSLPTGDSLAGNPPRTGT